MSFRIRGLDAELFAHLFELDDAALAQHRARRLTSDACPGFPCRVSLTDAAVGDAVILVNFEHQAADTPFRARHAIYVRPGEQAYDAVDEIPGQLRTRTLSLRAFDGAGYMRDAKLVDGKLLEAAIADLLGQSSVSYIQAHFAAYGCYAARIERA